MKRTSRQRVQSLGHLDARSEHEQRIAPQPIGGRLARQLAEGGRDAVLSGLTGIQDERRQLLWRPAVLEQGGNARLPPARGKPQHHGVASGGEPEAKRSGKTFDGQRDAAHDRGSKLDDEAWQCFEIYPGPLEPVGDRAAVRESVWIAGKQHGDLLAGASELDHLIDRFERRDVGIRLRKVKQTGAAAIAIANDVGVLDCFDCLHGRKTWMAWSYADELDRAHTNMSFPTWDMGDRLELSADHVLRQRVERRGRLNSLEFSQLIACRIRM